MSAPTRLLTPAVQRVIAWHQERIVAQHAGGEAEAPSPARPDAAPRS